MCRQAGDPKRLHQPRGEDGSNLLAVAARSALADANALTLSLSSRQSRSVRSEEKDTTVVDDTKRGRAAVRRARTPRRVATARVRLGRRGSLGGVIRPSCARPRPAPKAAFTGRCTYVRGGVGGVSCPFLF
jgi:hypothetical protein